MRHSIETLGLLLALAGCGTQDGDPGAPSDDGLTSPSSDSGGALAAAGGGRGGAGGAAAGSGTGGGSQMGTGGTSHTDAGTGTGGASGTGSHSGAGGAIAAGGAGGAPPTNDAGPLLTPGVWTNITAPGIDLSTGYGVVGITIDPGNPANLYAAVDAQGTWKTKDGGSTWARLGTKPAPPDYPGINAGHVSYLDCVNFMEVDPANSNHIYASSGTRGSTFGFWTSTDGGNSWTMSQGFRDASMQAGTSDLAALRVDPTDFRHILVPTHSMWKGTTTYGFFESKDGGGSWILHPPDPSWGSGSTTITFLYNPNLGIGDSRTWLVTMDGVGGWRTTDAGATWTPVPSLTSIAPHGGTTVYSSPTGALFAPATPYPIKSKDNGLTWAQLKDGLGFAYYFAVWGDGSTLYTLHSTAAMGSPYNEPFSASPESDGTKWAPYQGGIQKFGNGPYMMRFDPINRILYSANWDVGLWALRVLPP